jgi:hypothetical protein
LEGVSSWERRYIELGNFKNWIAYMGSIGSSSARKMPATFSMSILSLSYSLTVFPDLGVFKPGFL